MTYRAGIGPGLLSLGLQPDTPHVFCDVDGCNARVDANPGRGGGPPAWLRNGTAPPGWRTERILTVRRDFCPEHKAAK